MRIWVLAIIAAMIIGCTIEQSKPGLPYRSASLADSIIQIPNGGINVSCVEKLEATGFHNDYVDPQARLYLVQLKGPGLVPYDIYDYFEPNTYVILASAEQLSILAADPNVNFIEDYHPHYKFRQEVIDAFYKEELGSQKPLLIGISKNTPIEDMEQFLRQPLTPVDSDEYTVYVVISGIENRNELFMISNHPSITEIGFAKV